MAIAVRADQVLRALARRHTNHQQKDLFLTQVKTGATWSNKQLLIFDALAIARSWANPRITGYEVKVDRGDFLRDTKWPGYLPYCHEFYFVCPTGLIHPDELSTGVGLIYYSAEEDRLVTKRRAVHRAIELRWDLFYYIAICRTESDRHPFFSDRREFLEAWLQDKADKRVLGQVVGSRMAKELESLYRRMSELERELETQSKAGEHLEQLRGLIGDALGVRCWGDWGLYLAKVSEALKAPPSSRNIRTIQHAMGLIENGLSCLRKVAEEESMS